MENLNNINKEEKYFINRFLEFFYSEPLNSNTIDSVRNFIIYLANTEIQKLYSIYPSNGETISLNLIDDPSDSRHGFLEYKKDNDFNVDAIITFNENKILENLSSPDREKRITSFKELCLTVFHEVRHLEQYLMVDNKSSYPSNVFASEYAMQNVFGKPFIDKHYYFLFTENDANEAACNTYLEIMGEDKDIENLRNLYSGKKVLGKYSSNLPDLEEVMSIDSRLTSIIDFYPVLQKEFDNNGIRKTSITLIQDKDSEILEIHSSSKLSTSEKKAQSKDLHELYFELLYRKLTVSSEEDIDQLVSINGLKKTQKLFEEMFIYFDNKMKEEMVILLNMRNTPDTSKFNSSTHYEPSEIDKGIGLSATHYSAIKSFIDKLIDFISIER